MKKQGQAGAARQEEWDMTANEVHEAALALLFENRATAGDYNTFALPLFNLLLPELLETENGLRRAAGREELEQAPLLGSLEEQIPYDERLLRGALPYGLAAKLVYDDGDMGKVGYFPQLYVNAVNSFAQLIPEQVVDVY